MAVIELSSPAPIPSRKWESKYYLTPWGLPDLKYVITENNAWYLGSVPKELVMTITHSPDLSSNNTFLGKPSLTPSAPVRSPPAKRPAQHLLPPPMHFCSDLHEYLEFPRATGHWLDIAVPLDCVVQEAWQACIASHLLSEGQPGTVEGCSLPRTPDT